MGATEEAVILTRLVGAKEVVAGVELEAEALGQLAEETAAVGIASERTRQRTFLMNQALFTMRRFLYLTTLGTVALGAASIKWGYDYLSQMQQGQIALGKFMGSNKAARMELDKLFTFTAYTPFQFKDVVSSASMLMRFNVSATMTNRLLRNITDALAGTTKATPGGLNRITTALGHMMSMGHATGQTLLQLARDGIPGVYTAIKKYFGLSDAQMHKIGSLGLPSQDVLKAINQYVETSPLHGLAKREALGSLHGLLTTSRDFISRIMGQAMKPGFSSFQHWVAGMNVHLQAAGTAIQRNQPVMPALFGTHPGAFGQDVEMGISLLKNLWKILTQSVIPAFRVWLQIFQPLKFLLIFIGAIVGILAQHTTLLKYAMILLFLAMTPKWVLDFWSVLVERTTAAKLAMLPFRQALIWTGYALMSLGNMMIRLPIILYETWVLRAEYATVLATRATEIWSGIMYAFQFRMLLVRDAIQSVVFWIQFNYLLALEGLSGALETSAIASLYFWDALMGPVGWAIAILVTLALLYFRVKAFRDIVNSVVSLLWHHPLAAAFIPVVGQMVLLAHAIVVVYNGIKRLYDLLRHPLGSGGILGLLRGAVPGTGGGGFSASGILRGILGFATGGLSNFVHIPHLASGGTVVGGGWSWVGENGPELQYMPRGAVVTSAGVSPNMFPWSGGQFTPSDNKPIQVQLVCDGKVLAQVVAAHKDDVRARM